MYNDLFVGIEAEGRFKGLKTLFVPNQSLRANLSSDVERLFSKIVAAASLHKCCHIYFGASSDFISALNYQTVEHLVQMLRDADITWPVTIEVLLEDFDDLPSAIVSKCHILVRVTGSTILSTMLSTDFLDIEVKIEGPNRICILSGSKQSVGLDYIKDEEVVE